MNVLIQLQLAMRGVMWIGEAIWQKDSRYTSLDYIWIYKQ